LHPPFFSKHDHIHYKDNQLFIEQVSAKDIVSQHGTPVFAYSKKFLTHQFTSFTNAFKSHPHLICYALKANSNLSILNLFAKLGAGFDTVSQGEIERAVLAGSKPENIVFSGVGKTKSEIKYAIEIGVGCFNIESEPELYRIDQIAGELGKKAPISFRINPDVDANTHPDISTGMKENKFGIESKRAVFMYKEAAKCKNVVVKGIDCHIGSQITQIKPFTDSVDILLKIVDECRAEGIDIDHVDIGGGIGILYNNEKTIDIEDYAKAVLEKFVGRKEKLMFEPGRFMVGNAGVFLTNVEYLKHNEHKNFIVVDGAMNEVPRPAIYKVYHEIVNTQIRDGELEKRKKYDVVGPICESTDFFGKGRTLYAEEGDVIAILSAGAYCFSMSSNYNSRPRPPEVLVDGDQLKVLRKRETMADVVRNEELAEDTKN
jgi:diaminopimelate decarboxylase